MGFRENLKSELAYQGMLVKELAALSEVSRHTLDNYLNLRGHIPSADVAVKIARVLNVSVEYLVTGNEPCPGGTAPGSGHQGLLKKIGALDEHDRQLLYGIVQLLYERRKKGEKG
jgi:transcriptional regulator with XRE-family HTH domain